MSDRLLRDIQAHRREMAESSDRRVDAILKRLEDALKDDARTLRPFEKRPRSLYNAYGKYVEAVLVAPRTASGYWQLRLGYVMQTQEGAMRERRQGAMISASSQTDACEQANKLVAEYKRANRIPVNETVKRTFVSQGSAKREWC